jgi:hypothetical protein
MITDSPIPIKLKLSGLWTSVTFCYVYGDYFELYTPDKIQSLISGENPLDSPMNLLIASLVMALPPLMIAISLLFHAKVNRVLHIMIGSLFTLMMLWIAFNSLEPWYSFYVFLALLESVLTAYIVFLALKWPRELSKSSKVTAS